MVDNILYEEMLLFMNLGNRAVLLVLRGVAVLETSFGKLLILKFRAPLGPVV